jgi:hypothetical protein
MTGERETMQLIRPGAAERAMRGRDLNKVLGITWGGTFLAKHCLGTGSSAARFVATPAGFIVSRIHTSVPSAPCRSRA